MNTILAPNLGAFLFYFALLLKRGQVDMKKTIHSEAYKVVRAWLVTMRHERKLTKRDLAVLLGVSHSWVGKIETGERRLDIIEYIRVCKVMNINPHVGLDICLQQLES